MGKLGAQQYTGPTRYISRALESCIDTIVIEFSSSSASVLAACRAKKLSHINFINKLSSLINNVRT